MEKENKKEEIQNRREFFKKAGKTALPILAAITIAPLLNACKKDDDKSGGSSGCSDCSGSCSTGCSGGCSSGCGGCCDSLCGEDCWSLCQSTSYK